MALSRVSGLHGLSMTCLIKGATLVLLSATVGYGVGISQSPNTNAQCLSLPESPDSTLDYNGSTKLWNYQGETIGYSITEDSCIHQLTERK